MAYQSIDLINSWLVQNSIPLTLDSELLTALELLGKVATQSNNVVSLVNNLNTDMDLKETIDDLTNKRKLDDTGNFTGTWFGLKPTQTNEAIQSQVDQNSSNITNLLTQMNNILLSHINLNKYGMKGDYDGTNGSDNVIPFKNLISDNPNGGIIYLSGNYYISDENLLPNLINNFTFIGSGNATITFGKGCGVNTFTVPDPSTIPNWTNCNFFNITFSQPFNQDSFALFSRGSKNLVFEQCILKDIRVHFLQATEENIIVNKCKWIKGNLEDGTCLMGCGNVTKNFIFTNNNINFAPDQGSGVIVAATNDSRLIGYYHINNNVFFNEQLNGYYIDAGIDIEPNSANSLKEVYIQNNIMYNCKIYAASCEEYYIQDNLIHFTNICTGGASGFPISIYNSYNNTPIKVLRIERNNVICDDLASEQYKNPIYIHSKSQISFLYIEDNHLQYNGSQINNPNDPAVIYIMAVEAGISHVIIKDNTLVYTAVPAGTKVGAITVITSGSNVDYIDIRDNTLTAPVGSVANFFLSHNGGTQSSTEQLILIGNNGYETQLTMNNLYGTTNNISHISTSNNICFDGVK